MKINITIEYRVIEVGVALREQYDDETCDKEFLVTIKNIREQTLN